MAKPKQELTKYEDQNALVSINDSMELPAHLREQTEKLGSENVSSDDIIIPSLKLAQDLTEETKERNGSYIPGLKPGMFFNTVTKEVYGDKVKVIPIHFYKSRVRWTTKEMGSGVRCSSSDAVTGIGDPGGVCKTCQFSQRMFQQTDTDRKCTLGMNFPLFVLKDNEDIEIAKMAIYQMKSIACDTGKQWNALNNFRNKNFFDGTYILSSRLDERDSGDSFQPTIANLGWSTPQQSAIGKLAYNAVINWLKENKLQSSEEHAAEGTEV
jgi:hypothetical protein